MKSNIIKIIVLVLLIIVTVCCGHKEDKRVFYKRFPVQSINQLIELKRKVELRIKGDDYILGGVASICKYRDGFVVCDDRQAKVALAYDSQGNLVTQVGALGPGPGEYHCADVLCNDGEHILVFNHNPAYVNYYNQDLEFVRRLMLPLNPYRILVHDNKYFIYNPTFWESVKYGLKVAVFDLSFKPLAAMRSYEETLERIPFISGDCERVGDHIWFADIYDPVIHVCGQNGEEIMTLGSHLTDAPYCIHSRDFKGVNEGDFNEFSKIIRGRSAVTHIINLNNKLVLIGEFFHPFEDKDEKIKPSYFDIYDTRGNLIQKQVIFRMESEYGDVGNILLSQGGSEAFYLVDQFSDYLDKNNLNAIVYEYSLKDSFKLEVQGK